MSFFGNNNNNTSSGFGGSGFGSGNTGFGANNNTSTSGSLFGGNTATAGSGFGGGTGFGAAQNNNNSLSMFGGQKTGFGGAAPATGASGSLFGNNNNTSTASTGFGGAGGFGASQTSGFGGNTSGGLFGNKPATSGFGSTNSGSLFGGGNTSTTGGFGSTNTNTTNPFGGASTNTGFGTNTANTTSGFGGGGGFGGAAVTNNNGTSSTPFQPFVEKDVGSTNGQMSHYQTITFQDPYKLKSLEELRVEDYLQGRQYGNNNGQAGAFGSSGFGGTSSVFGGANNNNNNQTNTGSVFGGANNNNAATTTSFGGFGAANNNNNNNTAATSGFGASTGGGLFGQNKPATGLFGQSNTPQQTGGFGSTNTTSAFGGGTGFGATNNNNAATGSTGLFGANNNNNTANKTDFGGFGSTGTTGGFGATNQTNTGLFGNNQQQNNTGSSLFGNNNNNQTQQQQGGLFGNQNAQSSGGLFGNQAKPATGLFGASNAQPAASGGLFGNTGGQQNAGGSSLFGNNNANNNTNTGGLFGAAKPAGTLFGNTANNQVGGSLFGGNNAQPQSNSLFGNNANNNNQGSSLFGGQNKPATNSLFGGSTNNSGSLFGGGNQQNAQQGNSLFGGLSTNNQNAQNSSSLFGGATNSNANAQNAQNQLQTSLTQAPYGNEQLFTSLNSSAPNVGPLATPLTGAKSAHIRTPSLLASTRLNSPVYTPRGSGSFGPAGGYGFSYSTYGTPNSAYSVSLTPGASSLLKPTGSLSSALTSRLAKSVSMNNLRMDGTPREGESLLRPTPGSASSRYLQTGSMRKLNIDRSLRTDLFSPLSSETKQPEPARDTDDSSLRKKVSFDNHVQTNGQSTAEPNSSNALVRRKDDDEEESRPTNGASESQQSNGSALSTVPEDSEPQRSASAPPTKSTAEKAKLGDAEAGEYWTKPSIKDLKKMSRAQLSKLGGFTVGREGVGYIEFGPCDLTNTDLDDICGKIVQLNVRQATVYQDERTKPARGKALNVPSTIYLENSWPRSNGGKKPAASSGPAYDRHVARLRRIEGTDFKSYDPATGVWCFTVQHYTTYGLDDDDDEEDFTEQMNDATDLSEPPATPPGPDDLTMQSFDMEGAAGDMDDTFQFKINKKSTSSVPGKRVPGGFEDQSMVAYESDEHSVDESEEDQALGHAEMEDPFTSPGGAVQAPSPSAYERHHSSMMIDADMGAVDIAEDQQAADLEPELPGAFALDQPKMLRSILKPTAHRLLSPEKLVTEAWEDQLQRTMSPAKRDRQALKELQLDYFRAPTADPFDSPFKRSMLGQSTLGQSYLAQKSAKKVGFGSSVMKSNEKSTLGKSQAFQTSMDIMNSLWTQDKPSKQTAVSKGFEIPFSKKPRLSAADGLSEPDAAFHNSFKPSYASNRDILLYSAVPSAAGVNGEMTRALQPVAGPRTEIRSAIWTSSQDLNTPCLTIQKDNTQSEQVDGFTSMQTSQDLSFRLYAESVPQSSTVEYAIWRLTSVLFDDVSVACDGMLAGMSPQLVEQKERRLRMDAFSHFWVDAVRPTVNRQLKDAKTAEEKALLHLTLNDIPAATDVLAAAKDYKLATLVAQLPFSAENKDLITTQISAWKDRNDWTEMSDAVRALYSVISGAVCVVEGKSGPAENRATSFCIAERFGLSWMQSFGLRVFFGGFISLREATMAYVNDLKDGCEKVFPGPWWNEAIDSDREDTLLSLLRLASAQDDMESLLDAKTITGENGNSRIAWQLATNLRARGMTVPDDALDQLTVNFSSELERSGHFVTAVWVLLHLRSDATHRARAVQEILARNAILISEPSPNPSTSGSSSFDLLTTHCNLPAELLWRAKALAARSVHDDPALQAQWLLHAGDTAAALAVLRVAVGPAAVIAEDYTDLAALLARVFPPDGIAPASSSSSSAEATSPDAAAARVYADFVRLRGLDGAARVKHGAKVMARLDVGLRGLAERGRVDAGGSLEEWVAVVEMRRVLEATAREWNASPVGAERVRVGSGRNDSEERWGVVAGGSGLGQDGLGQGAFETYREAMGLMV